MGFLDFLFDAEKKEARKYAKLEKTLTNMYVQPAERGYTIEQLYELGTPEAVRVLLKRYGESAPNTTVDIEEKERVYDVLVSMGRDPKLDVVGVISEHLRETDEAVNWPMKVLTDLLDYDEFVEFLAELLSDCTTEYVQNPEKKQELVLRAQDVKSPQLAEELVRFLGDMNETIRFLAVDALVAQERDDLCVEPLAQRLIDEDSLRITQKIADAFADHSGWKIPEEQREDVAEFLPEEYGVHKEGHIYKHR